MADGGDLFGAVIFGCVLGGGGYALYQWKEAPPVIQVEIDYECSTLSNNYECNFFNRKREQGAICVKVALDRAKESEKYLKKYDVTRIDGNRVCSGVLSQGQNSHIKGTGFFGDGVGVTGVDFCTLRDTATVFDGCTMATRIVAKTE